MDLDAASRASARCPALSTTAAGSRAGFPSKIPERSLARRMRRTASSTSDAASAPERTASTSAGP